jgi:hypothetical protein
VSENRADSGAESGVPDDADDSAVRAEIDSLDDQLVGLLARRLALARRRAC